MTAQPPHGPQGPYEPQGPQQGYPQQGQFPQSHPQQGQPYPQQGYPQQGQPYPQGQYGPQNPQGLPRQPGQQQPYPGAPGAVPQPGYVPPGGPPQGGAYPGSGHPGGPGGGPGGPAGGKGKRNLVIAGAAGVAVLLVAGIGIAVAVSGPKVYTSFPDCEEAFPAEMFENALEREDIDLSGEFSSSEEGYGSLDCSVSTDDPETSAAVTVTVLEPESEQLQEQAEEIADFMEEAEAELPPGEVGQMSAEGLESDEAVWRPVSIGDNGFAVGLIDSFEDFRMGLASSAFVTDNLVVSVYYGFNQDDEEEVEVALDRAEDLAGEVESRLSRVGETE